MSPHWLRPAQRGALLLTAFLFSAGYATAGLLLVLITMIVEGLQTRRLPWRRSGVDWAILVFLAAFLISGWSSPYRAVAVGAAGAGALTIYVALGSLHAVLLRDKGFVGPFLITWVAGALVTAAWALSLHRMTGRALTPELGQNAVGTTLLVGLILGAGLLLVARGVWQGLLAVACVVLTVGLILTYTRGAWLGATLGLVALFSLAGLRRAGRGLTAIALIMLLGIAFLGAERPALFQRALSISSLQANQDRLFMFRSAWAIFVDNPLVGTGLNTFSLVYPNYRLPNDPNPQAQPFAHNVFLNMLAEGGLLGFAAFVTILIQAAMAGWRWYAGSRNPRDAIMSAATLAAFLGLVVHQMVDGTIISVHVGAGLWFLIALMIGAGPREPEDPPT